MNAKEDHWPSLPPIRTSSSSHSRVSCETLNRPPSTSAHAHTTSNASPLSSSHRIKPASKSAEASPLTNPSSPSASFSSHCFPHTFTKHHLHRDRRKGGTRAFDTTALLRSIFGSFSSPMVSFADRASDPRSWQTPPSVLSSPSGRMKPSGIASPISNSVRSGGATPLKNSKGHTGHLQAFTMMPPDVVGKKKPPGYESDEPKSPEVTCIGKVRRKHCKATWDALIKEKRKCVKKKGMIKRLSGEIPYDSDYYVCGRKAEGGLASMVSAKLSRARSGRQRSGDIEGTPSMDSDTHMPVHGDLAKEVLPQGMDDAHDDGTRWPMGSETRMPNHNDICTEEGLSQGMNDVHTVQTGDEASNGDAHTGRSDGDVPLSSKPQVPMSDTEQKLSSLQGETAAPEDREDFEADSEKPSMPPAMVSEAPCPPPDCLLLMRKGSRNRSAHHHQLAEGPEHVGTQWTWGQVLS